MEIDGDNEQIDHQPPARFVATDGPRELQEEEMTQYAQLAQKLHNKLNQLQNDLFNLGQL